MDFSRQLESLARAANSNSRDSGSKSNNTNNSNYNNNSNQPPRRHYDNNNNRGRHSYHPYNNNRRGGGRHHYHHNNRGQLTQAELEFYLPKLIEAIPKYHPIASNKKKAKRRHVALLFLTIDDLPFEHLWRAFLHNYKLDSTAGECSTVGQEGEEAKAEAKAKDTTSIDHNDNQVKTTPSDAEMKSGNNPSVADNANPCHYDNIDPSLSNSNLLVSVLCHAKFPERVKSPWLQRRLLVSKASNQSSRNNRYNNNNRRNNNGRHDNRRYNDDNRNQSVRYHTRRPEWGSVDITKAMIDLLEEGLKIGKSKSNFDHDERYSYARYMANDENDTLPNRNQDSNSFSNGANASSASMYSPLRKHQGQSTSNDSIPEVDRFIFVSESCLPVVTLQEMEMALFGPEEIISMYNNHGATAMSKPNQGKPQDHLTKKKCHEHYTGINANKSWVNAYNKPNNGYARLLQWDATNKAIPKNCIYKADQWIVLTRKHAWPLISLIDDAVKSVQHTYNSRNQNSGGGHHHNSSHQSYSNNIKVSLWQCFENVKASDEMYFPTAMALLGILNTATDNGDDDGEGGDMTSVNQNQEKKALEDPIDSFEGEIVFEKVTYCDWSEKGKNPMSFVVNKQKDATYSQLKERIMLAREEGCLIGRKFVPGGNGLRYDDTIKLEEWIEIIQHASK